ncbi:hypothetical protein XpruCFBP8353_16000 [Xanthomonas prunicola]|uniref:Uncharacterized protein n=1 Tax=Xanthomonas prunicola TaxID=2053930 RepID=A0A2N3RGT5_9XANT|nr:hypothetical protein XpruCFBP8353_16000 [Xanthomonas prunicola]
MGQISTAPLENLSGFTVGVRCCREWGVGNREWGVGNREWGVGNREWGIAKAEGFLQQARGEGPCCDVLTVFTKSS